MKIISKYISVTILLLAFVSCKKEMIYDVDRPVQGVDRDNVVDVVLPFSAAEDMETVIVTKAEDKDSRLASVFLMVYEAVDPMKPELNRYVYSKLFTQSNASNAEGGAGWFPDPNDQSRGKMTFPCPTGDVYIYLVANWTNSFIEYAAGVPETSLMDQNNIPQNQQLLFEKFVPKWTGNISRVDNLLPMIATVNNATGLCHIDGQGDITYLDGNGQSHTIAKTQGIYTENESFNFKRLMAKITVNIKTGNAVNNAGEFTPRKYGVRNASQHISPTPDAWKEAGAEFKEFLTLVDDTPMTNFSTQTPNGFTIYIPENLQPFVSGIPTQPEREKMVKTPEGKNEYYPVGDPLEGKVKFQNAPKEATYLEVTGQYENPVSEVISANVRFWIHLGDFSNAHPADTRYGDFNVKRDHHYQYTVTVNGVNDIIVESKNTKDSPSIDGIVFQGGLRANCDAHYDQVELLLQKSMITEKGIVVFADTPYGSINAIYFPKNSVQGGPDGKLMNVNGSTMDLETAKKLLSWIELRKQDYRGHLAAYFVPEQPTIDIFTLLDNCYNSTGSGKTYYTCFVDENYYTSHPITGANVHLSDFVNQKDRTFALGKDIYISKDINSICVEAIYLISQKSIATFYDLANTSSLKYGVESISETGKLIGYGPRSESETWTQNTSELWNGQQNSWAEISNEGQQNVVNWQKNGWLLGTVNGKDALIDQEQERMSQTRGTGYAGCLTRNRDFNGNGIIDKEELRWYNPALNQVLGLWIGESSLPNTAALYTKILDGSWDRIPWSQTNDAETGIYTSNGKNYRVLWAEEGASFGPAGQADQEGAEIRAVRNLGADITAEKDWDGYTADMNRFHFYQMDPQTRVVEVLLNETSLRAFSENELAPHTEREAINRPHRFFQLADAPMSYIYDVETAKGATVTDAINYNGSEVAPQGRKCGNWRLPNQRELALLFVIDRHFYDKGSGNAPRHGKLHCRTTFTLNDRMSQAPYFIGINHWYKHYGFWYNCDAGKIDCDEGTTDAGYFCIRDIQ